MIWRRTEIFRVALSSSGNFQSCVATTHVVGANFAFPDDSGNGCLKPARQLFFAEVIQHQLGGQEHGHGIHLMGARVFRGRTVGWFEDGVPIADVTAAGKAESPHKILGFSTTVTDPYPCLFAYVKA